MTNEFKFIRDDIYFLDYELYHTHDIINVQIIDPLEQCDLCKEQVPEHIKLQAKLLLDPNIQPATMKHLDIIYYSYGEGSVRLFGTYLIEDKSLSHQDNKSIIEVFNRYGFEVNE